MQSETGNEANPLPMKLAHSQRDGDPLRNTTRVVVRCKVAEDVSNTIALAGFTMKPGQTHVVTTYSDNLKVFEDACRTPDHLKVREHAGRRADVEAQRWITKRVGDIEADMSIPESKRAEALERAQLECPVHWAQYLEEAAQFLGLDARKYRTGLPPLESFELLREIEPPDTPENTAEKVGNAHATAIAQAMERLFLKLDGMKEEKDPIVNSMTDDRPSKGRRRR